MTRTAERWLVEGTDLRKIQIALNLEVYPFADEHGMYRVLSDVAVSLPQMASRCQSLISARKSR